LGPVDVWNKKLIKATLVGSIYLSISQLLQTKSVEQWYPLVSDGEPTGCTIRIKTHYTNEFLLPLPTYKPLLNVLVDPKLHMVSCLERIVEERDEIARILVRVMISIDHHEQYLLSLCLREIDSTASPSLIFRANSLASKSVDHFMKVVGSSYLIYVLKPVIKSIFNENRVCELDRTRFAEKTTGSNSEEIEDNLSALEGYIKLVTDRIFASVDDCPMSLRTLMSSMRRRVKEKWPEERDMTYIVVSSFLFLRFFSAAVLGPKLFGLCETFPNAMASRNLTLISKSMQQLSNLALFDGAKEPFMTPLNSQIESLIPKFKEFIDILAPLDSELNSKGADPQNQNPIENKQYGTKNRFVTKMLRKGNFERISRSGSAHTFSSCGTNPENVKFGT
jgi:hypothetical protein